MQPSHEKSFTLLHAKRVQEAVGKFLFEQMIVREGEREREQQQRGGVVPGVAETRRMAEERARRRRQDDETLSALNLDLQALDADLNESVGELLVELRKGDFAHLLCRLNFNEFFVRL